MMLIHSQAHPGIKEWRRAWQWLVQGMGLWRSRFWLGLWLGLAPLLVEGLLQLLPVAGVVLSKFITPVIGVLCLYVLHRRVRRTEGFPAEGAVDASVCALAVSIGLLAFVWQLMVLAAVAGSDAAWAVLSADAAGLATNKVELALMFASGVLPGALLGLMLSHRVLAVMSLQVAWQWNLLALRTYWRPLLVWHLGLAAALAALLWCPWLLLILPPVGLHGSYAMWRDIVSGQTEDRHVASNCR